MCIFSQGIPKLKDDFVVEMIMSDNNNENVYILSTPFKKYKISEIYFQLIHLMDGSRSYKSIKEELDFNISIEEVVKTYEEEFSKIGITYNSDYDEQKKKSFFVWKFELITSDMFQKVNIFNIFFNAYWIVVMFLIGLFLIVYGNNAFYRNDLSNVFCIFQLKLTHMIIPLVISYASIFAHELGHYFCCKYYNGKPGSIGIGAYFLMPVFYTNLNDIWRLKKSQRVNINLSGVYFQNIFLMCIATIAILMNNEKLFSYTLIIMIGTLVNLIPFIKLDGYWIVADIIDIPDLFSYTIKFIITKLHIKKIHNFKEKKLKKMYSIIFRSYVVFFSMFIILFSYYILSMVYDSALIIFDALLYQSDSIKVLFSVAKSMVVCLLFYKVLRVLSYEIKKIVSKG